jgi:hypothetical protein
MLPRRNSSKKGKFDGVELGERISKPTQSQPVPRGVPVMNTIHGGLSQSPISSRQIQHKGGNNIRETNIRDNENASQRIEKEAHRIATFMQRRDSVHHSTIPNDSNTNVPRKKYRAMPKMNIPEDSPVSIHVVKRDRISSHRSRLLNKPSTPTPSTIERPNANPNNREQLSPSPRPIEKKPLGFLSDIKFNTSTPKASFDANHRRPSPMSSIPVRQIESNKPSVSIEKGIVTNIVKEIPISTKSVSRTPPTNTMKPVSQSNPMKPISKTNPMKPISQTRPASVSQKSNNSIQSVSNPKMSVSLATPTPSTKSATMTSKFAPKLVSKNVPKNISKVSTKSSDTPKPQSQLKPRLVSGTRSRTRQSQSKPTSKKRSNAVEWSVKSSKLQFRPIIFSFILSNWELMSPPFVTETRWKKRIEPNLHYFSHLPNGIDQYLVSGICDGMAIKRMKHKRK